MIDAQLLNSDAVLNTYVVIPSLTYTPGENLRVVVQILKAIDQHRYIAPVGGIVTLTFTKEDESQLVKTPAVLNADDRSMWFIDLSPAETLALASNNFLVKLDVNGDGTLVYLTSVENGLIRTNLSGECC